MSLIQLYVLRNKLQKVGSHTLCPRKCLFPSLLQIDRQNISAPEVNAFREAYFLKKFNLNSPYTLMERRKDSAIHLRNLSIYSDREFHFTLGTSNIINIAESFVTPAWLMFGICGGCFRTRLCWLLAHPTSMTG